MNERQKTRQLKRGTKVLLIIFVGLFTFLGIWTTVYFVNVSSLTYVDDLNGYSLSRIKGSVELVDVDEYSAKIAPLLSQKNPVYGAMFPELIPNSGVAGFFYAETVKPTRNYFDRWEVYVCCKWSEDEYINEKTRLENFDGMGGGPFFRTDLFPFPSLVYTYQSGKFLYALLDEPTFSIHYIYLCEVGTIDNIVFDKKLAPTKPLLN